MPDDPTAGAGPGQVGATGAPATAPAESSPAGAGPPAGVTDRGDADPWQGRIDAEDGERDDGRALRWHQRVVPPPAAAPPGVALIGFACDLGVQRNHGRAGAAEGPPALRRALANLAWHPGPPVYDTGDVEPGGQTLETAQAEYGERVAALLADGHLPIGLGGGHEIAWAAWQGLARHAARQERLPRLGILNLDAHFDLRAAPTGNSGTPFLQIARNCAARSWDFRYCVLGIAEPSNTPALFDRARELGVTYRLDEELAAPDLGVVEADVLAFLAGVDWLYLTICLDVLPAACAPGVSAPAALGVPPAVVERIVRLARASGKLRLADVAELNPRLDPDGRTARIAARLAWRLARPA